MKNKLMKVIIFICMIVIILSPYVNAQVTGRNVISSNSSIPSSDYDPSTYTPPESVNSQKLIDMGQTVVGLIKTVGTVASVVMLAILGLKYMTGSIEEKVSYKKTMIPYIIGMFLLFASSQLVSIVYNFTAFMRE